MFFPSYTPPSVIFCLLLWIIQLVFFPQILENMIYDLILQFRQIMFSTKPFLVSVVFSTLLTSGGWLIRLSSHDPSPAASQGTNSLAPAKATAEKYSLGRNQSVNIAREKTDQRRFIF